MKRHLLLLQRDTGAAGERRHDGQVTVERSNTRWYSDGFEITCYNNEKVRVAFALDCCDREAIAHVARTEGIKSEDAQDLVITAVENRFGRFNMLAESIQWLTDNGSCFIAKNTRLCSGISVWNSAEHQCAARSQMEWLRLSSKHSSAIISR